MLKRLGNISILFSAVAVLFTVGCSGPKPPEGTITTVLNSDQSPVSDVTVQLSVPFDSQDVKPGVEKEGTTNASGKVTFEYEYPAILEIKAFKISNGDTVLQGTGLIKMMEDEHAQETVELQ